MKTPIAYYGGKQRMLQHILPMIPDHRVYCEPFCGGAAVFFAKPLAVVNILNDVNDHLINFYRVAKRNICELQEEASCYLYSRKQYHDGLNMLRRGTGTDVERAAAFWYCVFAAINNNLYTGMKSTTTENMAARLVTAKRVLRDGAYQERLEHATIDNRDALHTIKFYDGEDTFFYIDPPYVGANQGHYKGYTQDDFVALLDALKNIKGKFLLSSYEFDKSLLCDTWYQQRHVMVIAANNTNKGTQHKTEVLTYNYRYIGEQLNFFEEAV